MSILKIVAFAVIGVALLILILFAKQWVEKVEQRVNRSSIEKEWLEDLLKILLFIAPVVILSGLLALTWFML